MLRYLIFWGRLPLEVVFIWRIYTIWFAHRSLSLNFEYNPISGFWCIPLLIFWGRLPFWGPSSIEGFIKWTFDNIEDLSKRPCKNQLVKYNKFVRLYNHTFCHPIWWVFPLGRVWLYKCYVRSYMCCVQYTVHCTKLYTAKMTIYMKIYSNIDL